MCFDIGVIWQCLVSLWQAAYCGQQWCASASGAAWVHVSQASSDTLPLRPWAIVHLHSTTSTINNMLLQNKLTSVLQVSSKFCGQIYSRKDTNLTKIRIPCRFTRCAASVLNPAISYYEYTKSIHYNGYKESTGAEPSQNSAHSYFALPPYSWAFFVHIGPFFWRERFSWESFKETDY